MKRETQTQKMQNLVEHLIENGGPRSVNMTLPALPKLSKFDHATELEFLARAYDLSARNSEGMTAQADQEAIEAYLIPEWELEAIGARAIAAHLRSKIPS